MGSETPPSQPDPPEPTPGNDPKVVNVAERPSRAGAVQRVPHMDKVRWKLAQYLIFLLAGLILAVFILIATTRWTNVAIDDVRSIFEMMFTALVALVGSAVGFYYGSGDGQK